MDSRKICLIGILFLLLGFWEGMSWASQTRSLQANPLLLQGIKFKYLQNLKINPPTATEVPPAGPDPRLVLDLADILEDQTLLDDLQNVAGFDPHYIIQDKKASQVFYYLPREFLLLSDEGGYHLGVQYNYQDSPGKPSVTLTLELMAPFNPGDVKLLRYLLKEGLRPPAGTKIKVRALPALSAEVDLATLASGLTIPKERIEVTLGAHLRKPIRLSMLLTPEEVEEVLTQLTGEGLAGQMNIQVDQVSVPIPLNIKFTKFSGPKVEGLDDWLNHLPDVKIKNLTYFPLKLKGICAYRLRNKHLERYCRGLRGTIRPRQAMPFKVPSPERVLGSNLLMVWFNMRLDTNCKSCLEAIQKDVRRGVSLTPTTILSWEVIPNIFETLRLYKVVVEIRSSALSPSGQETTKVLEFSPDETRQELTLFLHRPNPHYRYRLLVITLDGDQFKQETWKDSDSLTQIIGRKQVQEVMPSLPSS